jgi:hypothetical protein
LYKYPVFVGEYIIRGEDLAIHGLIVTEIAPNVIPDALRVQVAPLSVEIYGPSLLSVADQRAEIAVFPVLSMSIEEYRCVGEDACSAHEYVYTVESEIAGVVLRNNRNRLFGEYIAYL